MTSAKQTGTFGSPLDVIVLVALEILRILDLPFVMARRFDGFVAKPIQKSDC